MAGGVMTTGQTNNIGRQHKRHRARHSSLRHGNGGQDFARLLPGAINRLRPALVATGSLGAASPPNDG
jgi:hypothetical protein